MNDIWNAKRKKLETEVIERVLNLFEHTQSVAFSLTIPKTRPDVFIIVGDYETIEKEMARKVNR